MNINISMSGMFIRTKTTKEQERKIHNKGDMRKNGKDTNNKEKRK